jgi:hypothetical protein
MALDLDGIAGAIAARYAAGQLTAPTGYATIRSSTANPPGAIGPTPAVVVSISDGAFPIENNGTRVGEQRWFVRFYLDQSSDLERAEPALRKWLSVLLYQHQSGIQLGGLVVIVRIESFKVGILPYGGVDYTGIELAVHTATSEAWSPTA